jgi:hypothetical protein
MSESFGVVRETRANPVCYVATVTDENTHRGYADTTHADVEEADPKTSYHHRRRQSQERVSDDHSSSFCFSLSQRAIAAREDRRSNVVEIAMLVVVGSLVPWRHGAGLF